MTGFGFGLLAVPLPTIILPPQAAVPLVRPQSLWSSGIVVFEGRRWLNLKSMWLNIAASIVRQLLGIRLAHRFDEDVFQRFALLPIIATGLLRVAGSLRLL